MDRRKKGGGEGETGRRRLCQTCFSPAGPRSHLLSSFKGVVMVTVAGSRGWESVAWYPCGLGCGSGDDGKASQLVRGLSVSHHARPGLTHLKANTSLPKTLSVHVHCDC